MTGKMLNGWHLEYKIKSSCRRHNREVIASVALHGQSSKRLAPPRNTKDRKHLQSTQTTVNRHNSQPSRVLCGLRRMRCHVKGQPLQLTTMYARKRY